MLQPAGEGWTVIGHRQAADVLRRCLKRDRVHHAYLFRGPPSVGKRPLAEWFAAALLCQGRGRESLPCQECRACRQWAAGVHPDFHHLEPLSRAATALGRLGIGLEAIQELQSHLSRRPVLSARRVALICGAEHLSEKAANALLKTLEEPSGGTVLLITWDGASTLPATVPSRCQRVELRLVPAAEIAGALLSAGLSRSQAAAMAHHAAGRPGRALRWMAQPETYAAYQREVASFGVLLRQPLSRRLLAAAELYQEAVDAEGGVSRLIGERLQRWVAAARDGLLAAAGCRHLCCFPEQVASGPAGSPQPWQRCLDALRDAQAAMESNANVRLTLEVLMLAMPEPAPAV